MARLEQYQARLHIVSGFFSRCFTYNSTQPSALNPLGNPPYPGYTSSNGPNWVDYLTVKYNASLLQTYNLAYGGATVASDLVAPYLPTVLSVKQQVQTEFLPGYTGSSSEASWTGADSVFAIWIGINDVGNSYGSGASASDALNAEIFSVYSGLVDQLYDAGARNFMFIYVPPVDRSPLTVGQGASSTTVEKADIASWNARVASQAAALKSNHTADANVWTYDANKLFTDVLNNPATYPQTAGIKNTTAYCDAYMNGTDEDDTLIASCGIPVNQYFWLNSLHPTYPIHDVVAQQVAQGLAAGPNVC
ncbi:Uu.00g128820.m01.CDS01 [Anthostomella pinea]|uniref:Uu.00g128820.m01.CDS01 n=1 Tax=Anthostomella pinea TaxID=933095 RepID=A0AAI8YFL5_9PEZI|nr:Uu.00g128820.m01.CDS01 [Anthostomella pinea]